MFKSNLLETLQTINAEIEKINEQKKNFNFDNVDNNNAADVIKTIAADTKKIEELHKNLLDAQNAPENDILSQVKQEESRILKEAGFGDFQVDNLVDSIIKDAERKFSDKLKKGTEDFIAEIDAINKEHFLKKEKLAAEINEIESLRNATSQMRDELHNIPNDNFLEQNYKAIDIMQHLEGILNKAKGLSNKKSDKLKLAKIINQFNDLKNGSNAEIELPINELNEEIVQYFQNAEELTNIKFLELRSEQKETKNIEISENIFLLQISLINQTINLTKQIKCFPDNDQRLCLLKELANVKYYNSAPGIYVKDLDQLSQKYISKKYHEYKRKPNQLNEEMLNLAISVGIFHSNISKLHRICLFVSNKIAAKYSNRIKIAQDRYPGIQAIHNYRILQIVNNYFLDIPAYLKSPISEIVENEKCEQFLQSLKINKTTAINSANDFKVTGNPINIIYGLEENFHFLAFCVDKLSKEISKLVKEKPIGMSNQLLKHKKFSNSFLTAIFFIGIYHDLMVEIIKTIESSNDFKDWE